MESMTWTKAIFLDVKSGIYTENSIETILNVGFTKLLTSSLTVPDCSELLETFLLLYGLSSNGTGNESLLWRKDEHDWPVGRSHST